MQFSCVRSFETRFEAEYAKSILDAEEIPAMVMADDIGGWAPWMIPTVGSALVLVNPEDVELADEVITGHGHWYWSTQRM